MEEKFSLKWNDFQDNTIKTFSKLRKEDDFFDVTLVSEDQKQMMAHKVVLSSCSEYFKNILKTNKHSHPMLCLTGLTSKELENVLDYAYHGEVQIFQEDINKFLDIAQILKLDGLLATQTDSEQFADAMISNGIKEQSPKQESHQISDRQKTDDGHTKAPVSTISLHGSSSVDEVEQKIAEYLGKNENGNYMCNHCGKVGDKIRGHMKNHIETHLEGISFSCTMCGKHFRSRNAQNAHVSRNHQKNKFACFIE